MTRDLYAVLGVERDASGDAVRSAYERRVTAAARIGDYKGAAAIDHAYEVLRDPHRRRAYDRTGVIPSQRREPLEQRFHQPVAVPFRQWSPVEGPDTRAADPRCPDTERRNGNARKRDYLLLAAVMLGLFAASAALERSGLLDGRVGPGPADGQAYVEVTCQPPTGSGYQYVAPAGTVATCANGAQPQTRPVAR